MATLALCGAVSALPCFWNWGEALYLIPTWLMAESKGWHRFKRIDQLRLLAAAAVCPHQNLILPVLGTFWDMQKLFMSRSMSD